MEMYTEDQKELHYVFVNPEKDARRGTVVPDEEVRNGREVCEGRGGMTLGVGSESFFALVMGRVTDEVRQVALWTMMFAHDIVICGKSRKQFKERMEWWRCGLETRGMEVNRSKTECMWVNERDTGVREVLEAVGSRGSEPSKALDSEQES